MIVALTPLKTRAAALLTLLVAVTTAWAVWPYPVFSHETESTTTTVFDREVVRILNTRCVWCHSEQNLSFPLMTYEQSWFNARAIKTAALGRHMPPWSAVRGYGDFANDNGLTAREVDFLVSWVDGGGPRNSGTVFLNVLDGSPPLRKEVSAEAHLDHWHLGEPSLVRRLPVVTLASAAAEVRRSVIDLGLTSERAVSALEYRPGDRRVVRAASFTVQETGQWVGSWTPWYGFVRLPPGTAFRLPPSSRIVAEIQYRGAAERIVEEGQLGLYFDDTAAQSASDLEVIATSAQAADVRGGTKFRGETRLTSDTYVLALRPEIVAGVRSVEVSARHPDGGTDVLLFARDLSIEWPTPYIFKAPTLLQQGTVLMVTAYFADSPFVPRSFRLTVSKFEVSGERPVH
jgi:hypothetical protein